MEKYKSLTRERMKVCGPFVRYHSADLFVLQFSDAMMRFERLAEKVKEDARADVRRQRIERYMVYPIYIMPSNPLIRRRIWEKLAEEGWQEEIAARKAEYEPGLLRIKGVKVTCPLGEKGTFVLKS